MPTKWYEAPFLGNGMMGTMVLQTGDQTMSWDVGRGDVQNHRRGNDIWGISRLPIGYFDLNTVGKIKGGDMQLDLWNAEATGTIQTDKGSIKWRSLVHTDHMVILTEIEPSEGERACSWKWKPEKAVCPRMLTKKRFKKYVYNPPFTQEKDGEVQVTVQPLLEGGETVTAWQTMVADGKTRLMVSVAHSFPEKTAQKEAVDVIRRVRGTSLDELAKSHREWWHAYYPISFVSLSDTWWESFYWIQTYKLAAGIRAMRNLTESGVANHRVKRLDLDSVKICRERGNGQWREVFPYSSRRRSTISQCNLARARWTKRRFPLELGRAIVAEVSGLRRKARGLGPVSESRRRSGV